MNSSTKAEIYCDQDMTDGRILQLASGTVAILSRPRPEGGGVNEDAAAVLPLSESRLVVAVADGMGGLPSGHLAAKLALEALVSTISGAADDEVGFRQAILDGVDEANRAVVEMGIGAGTTLALVEIEGTKLRSYHVGDSSVVVTGQRGKLKHITMSHSPVGYGVEAGLIGEAEALQHEDRHIVSNAIGTSDMKIEVGPVLELAPKDTVILGTDGLFDNMTLDEIVAAIRVSRLNDVVERLVTRCTRRMTQSGAVRLSKPDDLTFVLFRRR